MTTSLNDYLAGVTDPQTRKSLDALLTAIRTDLGVLYANTDAVDTALKGDSIINAPTLAIGSTPENVSTTAFQFRIDGVPELKAAVTAGTALTAATINVGTAVGTYYGGFVLQITTGGTISSLPSGTDQVHTTAAAALAAAQAITPTAANVAIGYVVVTANADSAWTAGTDDLTPASDCVTASYSSATDLSVTAASSITLTA